MGLVLLVVIWLITLIGSYFIIAKTWWLPVGASAAAAAIDHHFTVSYILMGSVFILAQLALGWFAWKYRDRGAGSQPAHYSHGNTKLEVLWTILTIILFVGLNLASEPIWSSERLHGASPGAVQVEVTAMQFAWYFRYAGPDGKFGSTKPELEDADVISGVMVVPVNREIEVILRSHDVIHSFFVPAMRFKQDTVPGLAIHMHFTPIQTGDYELACAELCGLGHYKMHGIVKVVSDQEFSQWLAAREAEKQ